MRGMLLAAALTTAACSVVPGTDWPAHDTKSIRAAYRTDGAAFPVPVSGQDLTILFFEATPQPAREFFREGRRYIQPQPGAVETVVRCRYRAYADESGAATAPEVLFSGAARLTIEDM